MQFNPNTSNNNPLFACYSSASQGAISIYKFYNAGDKIESDTLSNASFDNISILFGASVDSE